MTSSCHGSAVTCSAINISLALLSARGTEGIHGATSPRVKRIYFRANTGTQLSCTALASWPPFERHISAGSAFLLPPLDMLRCTANVALFRTQPRLSVRNFFLARVVIWQALLPTCVICYGRDTIMIKKRWVITCRLCTLRCAVLDYARTVSIRSFVSPCSLTLRASEEITVNIFLFGRDEFLGFISLVIRKKKQFRKRVRRIRLLNFVRFYRRAIVFVPQAHFRYLKMYRVKTDNERPAIGLPFRAGPMDTVEAIFC